jgi:hypothetical protein
VTIVSRLYQNNRFSLTKTTGQRNFRVAVSRDIIKPTPSDCILGSNQGSAISSAAKSIATEPEFLPFFSGVTGLETVTHRGVFHTGENGLDHLICPNCRQDIANQDWDFLNEWSNNISNNLTCPLCKVSTDIHRYEFAPELGFSDLGFTFWNWPVFAQSFIEEFKQKLDCDVDIVNCWM